MKQKMLKYLRTWLWGHVFVFSLPFDKYSDIKNEEDKKYLIERSNLFARIYGIIWFDVVSISLIHKLSFFSSIIVGFYSICFLNGIRDCVRLYAVKVLKKSYFKMVYYIYLHLAFFIMGYIILKILNENPR